MRRRCWAGFCKHWWTSLAPRILGGAPEKTQYHRLVCMNAFLSTIPLCKHMPHPITSNEVLFPVIGSAFFSETFVVVVVVVVVVVSSCWPTRDHIVRSTRNFNPVMTLVVPRVVQTTGFVHPQPTLPNCINTEPTTSIGQLIKSSRLLHLNSLAFEY